jgi:hypothetical protein
MLIVIMANGRIPLKLPEAKQAWPLKKLMAELADRKSRKNNTAALALDMLLTIASDNPQLLLINGDVELKANMLIDLHKSGKGFSTAVTLEIEIGGAVINFDAYPEYATPEGFEAGLEIGGIIYCDKGKDTSYYFDLEIEKAVEDFFNKNIPR